MDPIRQFLLFATLIIFSFKLSAQELDSAHHGQCGTMERLEYKFKKDPAGRARFEQLTFEFNSAVKERSLNRTLADAGVVYTIPVVFHIVLANPNVVTNAMIQAQLDTLNKDFAGLNGDSSKIPSYFKALFGKSGIQFCLAQRTPAGEVSTGIERIVTSQPSFSNTNDRVKHISTGGADIWDQSRYFNVWVCVLSNSILGYSTFPGDNQPDEQGVVVDYRSLPGGSYANYNTGKTLVHESGHYFNLLHIWGDDDGACTGTDFVDDTPNQANSTSSCFTGVRTDNCTASGNGIMYQNFMDYSYDPCLVMFTTQQVVRMESALMLYRSSLLSSNGCAPVVKYNYDAQLVAINQPAQRLCDPSFVPVITLKNAGTQVLTSAVITVKVDDITLYTYNWTGSLTTLASALVTLNNITVATGRHTLAITVANPSGNADEDVTNNTLSLAFQYYPPVSAISESFEGSVFPPEGWDVVNGDNSITWQRVTGIAKTGVASAMINNYNYTLQGQKDELRLPGLLLAAGLDSAFLSFQVAASSNAATNDLINNNDTLEVLVSSDCGKNYSVVYRKWQTALNTSAGSANRAFIPTATEWRKDSVDLSAYIGGGAIIVAFRNTNTNQNNIYLDDVNLRKVIVNPNLKSRGLLVTPNPTFGDVAVQFYPQPVDLKAIQVFNMQGQKLAERQINGQANNYYSFNFAAYSAGMYMIRIVFADTVITRKVLKF